MEETTPAVSPIPTPHTQGRRSSGGSLAATYKLAKMVKLFKSVKVLKAIASFASMGFSVFAYSFSMGLAFAFGFVGLLFCHETGHAVALRRKGLKASLPVFIPFLGAAIFAPDMGDRDTEAHMAFAGPLIGTVCSVAVLIATELAPGTHPLLLGIAFTGLALNLFNLIPVSPLDGGRVTQAIGPWFRYVGIAVLVALTIALRSPGLLVIWVLVLTDLRIRNKLRLQIGLLVEAFAAFLMLAHIGVEQNKWIDLIDLGMMSIFNLLFWWLYRSKGNERTATPDERAQLTRAQKARWGALYAGLAVFLIVMLVVCRHVMPAYMTA